VVAVAAVESYSSVSAVAHYYFHNIVKRAVCDLVVAVAVDTCLEQHEIAAAVAVCDALHC